MALYPKIHVICKCSDKGDAAIKKGLSIVTYCVLDILTFSIYVIRGRILQDFDVTHPDVNTELSTTYLLKIPIPFVENMLVHKVILHKLSSSLPFFFTIFTYSTDNQL